MTEISEIIDQHQTGDPDETAAAVMDALEVPAKWRDLFYGLLRDECRRTLRGHVRGLERGNPGHREHGTHPRVAGVAATPAATRDAYLNARFYTGTKYVTWGEATIEQHLERIAYLSKLQSGISDTIARHQHAVDVLVAAGADCLSHVTEEAA